MDFLPFKPTILNAIVWLAIILVFVGLSKGIGGAGANYFIGGILFGVPCYFANVLIIEGFSTGKH